MSSFDEYKASTNKQRFHERMELLIGKGYKHIPAMREVDPLGSIELERLLDEMLNTVVSNYNGEDA